MAGAQERKLAAHAGSNKTCSGLYMMNKLFILLLLRAPTCRASIISIFAKMWPCGPSTAKRGLGHICGIMHMTSRCALLHGIFSAYTVIQYLTQTNYVTGSVARIQRQKMFASLLFRA